MTPLMKNRVVKARVICEELYHLNEDSLELVLELINDDEIFDKYGETLENLKENLEKTHNLL
ncbi:hypothetical protein [Campylobacter vulpis]|uniref:hypothetical protein n=1 Tax=Campylobacter vulpis TaxID=1655500 RepID=UPI000C15796D|nr:hypothetical protein [Campylobacter vulpis]MBS4275658.1 hypothetical protein [Campylobacter vulpis]MBS4306868.1 hypothetical protein [Campylobacter vulpis]MBS4329009.1 hypothetical protein [Campylobacter vulpis]MBS4422808.1 hypothetical protein [Campylobacter vulpis]PHY89944.1 hypothetical protein AA995_07350 [Campylobacter vulpis]